ncbi:PAS domain S-box protein [Paraburkholderia kirstenboschensis]|uniref:histidine kinase n=1 Tax=Paraburkholderia kirstenboschensis TaxID=1245436 RepID=A0ABZ0ECC8_9BURK|nr:PAS domain S-box protein [Paraburkholderia kirstenboschensis]WOD13907.1 PAS domain S-box protein [Paraburkholderia kirstenboschensis]
MNQIEPDVDRAPWLRERDRTVLVPDDSGYKLLDGLLDAPIDSGIFLRRAIGIASALATVHRSGLVHKDVKPANILVNPDSGEVRLTGFGLASRLTRERQRLPLPPESIAGTLAYMAPEQTGRMNRSVDSRSDLYAFGVTLYQMLTGCLPFTAVDPMEWVHCHIARKAVPPHERVAHLAPVLSAIVMKLLAKTADERYQTAAGVEADLQRCLAQWETERRIGEFPLGEFDTPDRLMIPEKLYGRSREVETLLGALQRVVERGAPELVLVSGYSGIGKSSLVNELHPVLVPPRALFAAGKFDQYKRDIPYSTLAQAFRSLLRPLLGKSEAELATWRDALREALGPNAGLVVDLVPEVAHMIGQPAPVPELPPQDAQRRFQLTFRRFIEVFARPEHPLVLFLDDLQWLDVATLDLMEDLLTRSHPRNLMLIGTYRDNEVTAGHPLMRKLDAIKAAGGKVEEITLTPLAREHLEQLMADALRCRPERIAPLAWLVHDKTAGNPFFAIQFISSLTEEAMLVFDHDAARWSWDLDRIHTKGYTDNVVELMVGKLSRLSDGTRRDLQLLACIGNSAELSLLETVSQRKGDDLHDGLWEAIRAGLITCTEHSCGFVHDRIQEAAYSLIPEEARAQIHLRIGRLLAECTPLEKLPEMIFEIVNQLNRGTHLITLQDEREKLAGLNLIAGKRAKAASAYASALTYLRAGAALLREDAWERQQELAFALELHGADCELWMGGLPAVEKRLAALAPRAADTVQRAAVASRRVDLYTMLGDCDRAVAVGLEYLRHVEIDWAAHPTPQEAHREYERIWSQLGSRQIEEIIDLPLTNDPECLGTLDVLINLGAPALFTDGNLYALTVCRAANLSLERGNSDGAPAHYVAVALIAGDRFGHHDAGYRLGKVACDLAEHRGLTRLGGKAYLLFALVVPWTRPLREGIDQARRAFQMANEQGDPTFAAYACRTFSSDLFAAGDPLDQVERESEQGLEFVRTVRFGLAADMIVPAHTLVRTLRGETAKFGSLDDGSFTERSFEARLTGHPAQAMPECFYWIRKLQARFFAGDYASAVDAAENAEGYYSTATSLSVMLVERAEYHLYAALSRAACCEPMGPDPYAKHRDALSAHEQQLRAWAENCPQNFEDRAVLVGAEIARIEGRLPDAMDLYEQAIRCARSNGFIQNEALSYELAARCYAARGLEEFAHLYLGNARRAYLRWGALGKVRQLDQLHPALRQDDRAPAPAVTIDAPVEHLDLATVIKVSQAVSGEIVPEKLIESLLHTAIEHAGADRGLLILPRDSEFLIQAEAKTSGSSVSVSLRETPVAADELPDSVVRYAARTREIVILDDTSVPNPHSTDQYIAAQAVRSVLCLPLMKQGALVGLLYLENRLASGVFTPGRISALKVLASQAAISLENSSLYGEIRGREAQIRRLIDANIVGIIFGDQGGQIFEANDAFLRMVGYEREDLVAGRLRWTDLTPREWLEQQQEQNSQQFRRTGSVPAFEKEYFHKDGSRVPVLIGVTAFDEGCERGVAFVVDMTERKRAEAELRRSRQYLAEAQKVSHTGSWAWSPVSNAILYWSDECYRVHGHDPAKGLPSFERLVEDVHPDDRARIVESFTKAVRDGADWELEYRLRNFDTGVRTLRSVGNPVLDRSGQVIEYIGTVIDVTEQKRAEQEREEHLWFLECMDRINRAMQRTNEVEGMTRGVLEEARAIFDCDRAWLVYPCDPDAPTCRALMEHTHPDYPGVFALDHELTVDARTAQTLRDMLHTPASVVDPGIPPEVRERFNILSTIAIVVRPRGDRPYLFGLHQCSHVRSWTTVEQRLFEEIGRRLEDALTSALAHRNLLASEEALRASEERFQTLVDHATDAIFLYDDEDIVIDVNRQACEALGYTRKELIGMGTCQFDPDLSPEKLQWIKERLREDGSATFNARHRRKDGSLFPVEVRARTFNRGGRLFAIALASDITERRHREQRQFAQFSVTRTLSEAGSLEEAAPHILRELCEALEWDRGAFWCVDPEAGVLVCVQTWPSDTFARAGSGLLSATGGVGKELPWRVWSSGAPAWIPDMALDREFQEEAAAKEGLRAAFAFPVMLRTGVLGVIEFFSREARDADPELLRMMTSVGYQIGQFIEHTRAEDALRLAREKLVQASQMATVAELSASIAHEINQPLQSVVANGQACRRWLAATPPDIDKARLSAEAMVRDGYATADVISRIRALFQRTTPAKVDLDINKLILQVCTLMDNEIHGNLILLETQLAQDVPMIRADAVQIQQVIVNLVRNAIEAFSATVERPKSLAIRSRRDRDNVVVDVEDEGMGIPNLETIFEPFTTTKETGMGMGLAICRSIVEAHTGRIWVVRNEIRGVTFSFSLPTGPSDAT